MFSSLEPSYFWQYTGSLFSEACKRVSERVDGEKETEDEGKVREVGAGQPTLMEVRKFFILFLLSKIFFLITSCFNFEKVISLT